MSRSAPGDSVGLAEPAVIRVLMVAIARLTEKRQMAAVVVALVAAPVELLLTTAKTVVLVEEPPTAAVMQLLEQARRVRVITERSVITRRAVTSVAVVVAREPLDSLERPAKLVTEEMDVPFPGRTCRLFRS